MDGRFVFQNIATFFHYSIKIVSVAKMTLISFLKLFIEKKLKVSHFLYPISLKIRSKLDVSPSTQPIQVAPLEFQGCAQGHTARK